MYPIGCSAGTGELSAVISRGPSRPFGRIIVQAVDIDVQRRVCCRLSTGAVGDEHADTFEICSYDRRGTD
jgi:hypothetical protein